MPSLERVIEEKVAPLINEAMHKYLGATVQELRSDIADRLKKSPLLEFDANINEPFKKQKKAFKAYYFARLLQNNFGNVSAVARLSGLDRRSVHRTIHELRLNVAKFREVLQRAEYLKQHAIQGIIESALTQYHTVLHPERLSAMYANVPTLTKDIVQHLPEEPLTYDEAEREFETRYVTAALEKHAWNISATAKTIGLRFETLHRKMKALGIVRPA